MGVVPDILEECSKVPVPLALTIALFLLSQGFLSLMFRNCMMHVSVGTVL